MKKNIFPSTPRGFSLFEIVIVVALLILLFSITTVSFYSILKRDELTTTTYEIVNTIKEAQTKTLSGTTIDNQNPTNFGVYFEAQQYLLFEGETFTPDNPNNNPSIDLPQSIIITQINLPASQLSFEKVTGKILNFAKEQSNLIVKNNTNNQTKTISINEFGVINVQ